MKLLYIIAQEDDGRYISILLDQPPRKKQTHSVPESVDLESGIITSISPEQEAEDERVASGVKTMNDRNLDSVLKRNNKKEEE